MPLSVLSHVFGLATGEFPKMRSTSLGAPNNMDYSILGSILGLPYLGKLPLSGSMLLSLVRFSGEMR